MKCFVLLPLALFSECWGGFETKFSKSGKWCTVRGLGNEYCQLATLLFLHPSVVKSSSPQQCAAQAGYCKGFLNVPEKNKPLSKQKSRGQLANSAPHYKYQWMLDWHFISTHFPFSGMVLHRAAVTNDVHSWKTKMLDGAEATVNLHASLTLLAWDCNSGDKNKSYISSAPKHSRSQGSKAVVQGKPPSLPRIPYQAEEPSAGNNEEMSACFVINIK